MLSKHLLLLLDHPDFVNPLLFLDPALLLQTHFFSLSLDPLPLQPFNPFLLSDHSQSFSFNLLGFYPLPLGFLISQPFLKRLFYFATLFFGFALFDLPSDPVRFSL